MNKMNRHENRGEKTKVIEGIYIRKTFSLSIFDLRVHHNEFVKKRRGIVRHMMYTTLVAVHHRQAYVTSNTMDPNIEVWSV